MSAYAVIGAGAIGGFYGARLAQSGQEVHFLFRGRAPYVSEHGLQVISPDGDFLLTEVNSHADWSTMPQVDVVIVAVKAGANEDVAGRVGAILKPGGAVMLIQNGLSGEQVFAHALGDAVEVIGASAFISVVFEGSNVIRHFDFGLLSVGAYLADYARGEVTPTMQTVAEELAGAGIASGLEDDLLLARWKKLLWNIPFNALSVILDARTDELMANDDAVELISIVMDEVRAGCAADGREIPREAADFLLEGTKAMKPYSTSMRVDFEAGRHLEVEGLLGEPLARARANGVELATITALYRQLKFIDSRQAG